MDHLLLCSRYSGPRLPSWPDKVSQPISNISRLIESKPSSSEFHRLKRRTYRFDGTSAPELTHVVSPPTFDVARLMQATLQQCVDSSLARGALNRGNTCVPLGRNFCVGG